MLLYIYPDLKYSPGCGSVVDAGVDFPEAVSDHVWCNGSSDGDRYERSFDSYTYILSANGLLSEWQLPLTSSTSDESPGRLSHSLEQISIFEVVNIPVPDFFELFGRERLLRSLWGFKWYIGRHVQ
jgi:hypothetical protein